MKEWEIRERRWRICTYAIGISIGTVVIFLLLLFVARHSPEKEQDQMSIICNRLLHEKRQGESR